MARMIPPVISDIENTSDAEIKVFEWLRDYKDDSVIVLHSLDLPEHETKQFGEIDFVLICKDGILCIEVKGGRVYRDNEGMWVFENRYGHQDKKSEGPFGQVAGNMQSLRKYFVKKYEKNHSNDQALKNLTQCIYANCVMMPDCTINHETIEVNPEILFEMTDSENELEGFFGRVFTYWKADICKKHPARAKHIRPLSNEDISKALKILRGDFNYVPKLSVIVDKIDEQFVKLTEQQYRVMQGLKKNDRLLVEGSAGTGKTMLAIYQAQMLAEDGMKVLYLCKNKALAGFIRELSSTRGYRFDVYNIDGYLVKVCGMPERGFFSTMSDSFKELPKIFVEKVNGGNNTDSYAYDAVIIDEGQDLINYDYYECIDSIIRGGFKNGKWTVYFDRLQNILNRDMREKYEEYDLLKEEAESLVEYTLFENCRNTKQIIEANFTHTGKEQGEARLLNGIDVEFISFKDFRDEKNKVYKTIKKLLSSGVNQGDIVLLSRYRLDNQQSCLEEDEFRKEIGEIRVNPDKDFSRNSISYYTQQAFKGLESKYVLMLDVDGFEGERDRRLNYVGMSRAKVMLYMFYQEDKEAERQRVISENLENI